MPEVITQVDPDDSSQNLACPPPTRTMRFCPKCGRHDGLGGTLTRSHWSQGKPCRGVSVLLEYALVEPEHARLEREVIEASKHWRRAQGESLHVAEVDATRLLVVRAWFLLRKTIDALNEFESQQK